MNAAHRRHDISDHISSIIAPQRPQHKGSWGVSRKTIANLLMLFFGFYGRVLSGVTFFLIMAIGKIYTGVFAGEEIRVYGGSF